MFTMWIYRLRLWVTFYQRVSSDWGNRGPKPGTMNTQTLSLCAFLAKDAHLLNFLSSKWEVKFCSWKFACSILKIKKEKNLHANVHSHDDAQSLWTGWRSHAGPSLHSHLFISSFPQPHLPRLSTSLPADWQELRPWPLKVVAPHTDNCVLRVPPAGPRARRVPGSNIIPSDLLILGIIILSHAQKYFPQCGKVTQRMMDELINIRRKNYRMC